MILKRLIAALALAASLPVGIHAASSASLPEIPAAIKEGPADENRETSQAISAILERCAAAYQATSAMHATGTYVIATKEDKTTTYTTAKLTLDYRRPNKLAVTSKSDKPYYTAAFYADGTTNTQTFGSSKEFVRLPQPDLASYGVTWRAGDIHEDFSHTLTMSAVSALLTVEDKLYWIHENVVRYVFEGEEEVGNTPSYRLRFNLEDNTVVVAWISKKTFLIHRISTISSYNEDYEPVDSFEEGYYSNMRLTTWDTIDTRASSVRDSAFKAIIPKGYKEFNQEEIISSATARMARGSFWDNLVSNAAKASPQETTWSLTSTQGDVPLQLELFTTTDKPAVDIDCNESVSGHSDTLFLSMEKGVVNCYSYDGKLSDTLQLDNPANIFAWRDTADSGPIIYTTDKESKNLIAYDPHGKTLWKYELPYATISGIHTLDAPESSLYVNTSDMGIRRLTTTGVVEYANADLTGIRRIISAPAGQDIMVMTDTYNDEVVILNKNLKKQSSFSTNEFVSTIWWDKNNPNAPLLCLSFNSDRDILLQRRNLTGDVSWTTNIEPKAKNTHGAMSLFLSMKVNGKPQDCVFIATGTGKITIADTNGKIIYRGALTANDTLVQRNDGSIFNSFFVGDVNSDGFDEIYFALDTHMMRLKTN